MIQYDGGNDDGGPNGGEETTFLIHFINSTSFPSCSSSTLLLLIFRLVNMAALPNFAIIRSAYMMVVEELEKLQNLPQIAGVVNFHNMVQQMHAQLAKLQSDVDQMRNEIRRKLI
jgi:hypothetical protein